MELNKRLHHLQHAPLAGHVQWGLGGHVSGHGQRAHVHISPRLDQEYGRGRVLEEDGSVQQCVGGAIGGLVQGVGVTSVADLVIGKDMHTPSLTYHLYCTSISAHLHVQYSIVRVLYSTIRVLYSTVRVLYSTVKSIIQMALVSLWFLFQESKD